MQDLIQNYSFSEILTFLVLFGLAIKGCISFFDWAFGRTKLFIHKTDQPEELRRQIKENSEQIKEMRESILKMNEMIKMLVQSDKDAIKAYITKQNLFFVHQQGWIDAYSLDCLQKRYDHYQDQGGNSFIETLMGQLRNLPRVPREHNKEEIT